MKKVKVGIISFQHMHALSYTRILQKLEGVEISGIADSDNFRGTEMAARFNTAYYDDYKELLKTDIDGVVICTCNRLHAQVTVDAVNAKKHVLVEKPFAISYEDARAMIKACENNNVNIMTAFPMRFNKTIKEAKNSVDNGEIGEILCITGINHGKIPSGWFLDKHLAGGGAVMDHTVHIADLMRWFTGSEVKSVYAESGELIHNAGIDDCGIVNVEFENGVFGTIDCSWAHHKNYTIWPEVYMEILGTKGVLEVDAFKQNQRVYTVDDGIINDDIWGSDGDEGLIREFVDVLRTGKTPKVMGIDGERAMEVALAAYKSSQSNNVERVIHEKF
jgi:predicted dehydrogenase